MHGDNSSLYILARSVLLDALFALRNHLEAITIVGAQAIYLHTGDADLAISPFTTDADLAIDPSHLQETLIIGQLMKNAGFLEIKDKLGSWEAQRQLPHKSIKIHVDLLVPSSIAGNTQRSANLGIPWKASSPPSKRFRRSNCRS